MMHVPISPSHTVKCSSAALSGMPEFGDRSLRNRTLKVGFRRFAIATLAAVAIITNMGSSLAHGKPDASQAIKKPRATRVIIDTVRREPMRQTVPILGRFVSRQTGPVAARVAGAIGKFRVAVGDRVKEGDLMATLIKDRLVWQNNLQKAEVSHFTAQVHTKKREVKLLLQELKRLQSLRKSPAFSQARLDDKVQQVSVAESAMAEAAARLLMAKADLQLSAISLHNAEIRAPYSGIISKKHVEVGAYVGVGAPVVTIIDNQSMEIEADVPAPRTVGLALNTVVSAELEDRTRINVAVRAIIPEENPRTRTRAVRFIPKFGETHSTVASNQSVTLLIPAGAARNVVTVHKDALLLKKGKRVVFLAQNGRALIRHVSLGEATGSRFSVTRGLEPGDLVVIRGNERLRPGTPITFSKPSGKAGKRQDASAKKVGQSSKFGKGQ